MRDEELRILGKGDFRPIDGVFVMEGVDALMELSKVQVKYNKPDQDTLLNELHDSIVGHYLGFSMINIEKHGFDCKYSEEHNIFLESKVASFNSSTWSATFNDTNLDKAEAFKSEKVWLALSVWKNASELMFICYGQNPQIGEFLSEKVNKFLSGNAGVRSTQTIPMSKLVLTYGFKILSITDTPEELYRILSLKNRSLIKIPLESITMAKDFVDPFI